MKYEKPEITMHSAIDAVGGMAKGGLTIDCPSTSPHVSPSAYEADE